MKSASDLVVGVSGLDLWVLLSFSAVTSTVSPSGRQQSLRGLSCHRLHLGERLQSSFIKSSLRLRVLSLIGLSGGNVHPGVCFSLFLFLHTRPLVSSFLSPQIPPSQPS